MIFEYLIVSGIQNFGSGFILGIIRGWNMKVFLGIFILLLAFFIIGSLYIGTNNFVNELSQENYGVLKIIYGTILVFLGIETGKYTYERLRERLR